MYKCDMTHEYVWTNHCAPVGTNCHMGIQSSLLSSQVRVAVRGYCVWHQIQSSDSFWTVRHEQFVSIRDCCVWHQIQSSKTRYIVPHDDRAHEMSIEWRRCIGGLKLQVSFRKRATNCMALLRKMSYRDMGSYESWPSCIELAFEKRLKRVTHLQYIQWL